MKLLTMASVSQFSRHLTIGKLYKFISAFYIIQSSLFEPDISYLSFPLFIYFQKAKAKLQISFFSNYFHETYFNC